MGTSILLFLTQMYGRMRFEYKEILYIDCGWNKIEQGTQRALHKERFDIKGITGGILTHAACNRGHGRLWPTPLFFGK